MVSWFGWVYELQGAGLWYLGISALQEACCGSGPGMALAAGDCCPAGAATGYFRFRPGGMNDINLLSGHTIKGTWCNYYKKIRILLLTFYLYYMYRRIKYYLFLS